MIDCVYLLVKLLAHFRHCVNKTHHQFLQQKNSVQIESDMIATALGCSRFHQYIYKKNFKKGKKINNETDLEPLETLFTKPCCTHKPC